MSARPRILVVDDEASNRKLLADLVVREGFEAIVAAGGAEALEILTHEAADLVLLDLMMPRVDGMTVLTELQRRGALPSLPVVVVTAHEDRKVRIDALTAGAIDFLAKPIDRMEVACRIRALIELKQLRERAVASAKDSLFSAVRDAVGGLPLALYSTALAFPRAPAASATDSWVVGEIEKLIGLRAKEFLAGAPWLALIDPDHQRSLLRDVDDGVAGEASSVARQLRLVRSDGNEQWILNVATLDRSRQIQTGTLFDITAQKKLEAGLLQSQKMEAFGQLAGGVAHDFNNILTAILSFAGFVRDSLPPDDERQKDLVEVLMAADRATDLTRQLLTFSRQQPTDKRPTELNQSVAELSKLLRRTLGDHVELVVTAAPRPAIVVIDPIQFDQIVLNLAVNARDAMPNGGRLQITLAHDGDCVRLTVTDTGTGMDEATQQRIFEPFFTTKSKGKGTGLGLATCFGIVQSVGGTIRVESELGSGTTFIVDLPASREAVGGASRRVDPLPRSGRGEQVLVVEDEPSLRRAAARVLEAAGFHVHLASNGQEALAKLGELGPTLKVILTDVVMPGLGGYEVAAHAATLAPNAAVLLTSGYLDERMRENRPANLPILWKPLLPSDLVRAVTQAIVGRKSSENA